MKKIARHCRKLLKIENIEKMKKEWKNCNSGFTGPDYLWCGDTFRGNLMGMYHPVNMLVVTGKQCMVYLVKFDCF